MVKNTQNIKDIADLEKNSDINKEENTKETETKETEANSLSELQKNKLRRSNCSLWIVGICIFLALFFLGLAIATVIYHVTTAPTAGSNTDHLNWKFFSCLYKS